MGYVVNKRRFKQSGPEFLLPYSNKSKVITYLTPDNFKGSSSTTWGDEYAQPMNRGSSYASWELSSDGKSVHINPGYAEEYGFRITAPSNLYNFTMYIVAKYSGGDIYLRATSSSPQYHARIFDDNTSSSKQLGSTFATWHTGNYSYFYNTSAYDDFQAYALSYQRNNKPIHVLNASKVSTFPYNGDRYPGWFVFYSSTSSPVGEAYIKLLAIVSESESSTVLQNNINFIRTQLNIT